MSSALVLSRDMPELMAVFADVSSRAFLLDVRLRAESLRLLGERLGFASRQRRIAHGVARGEDRFALRPERLVVGECQGDPVLAAVIAAFAEEIPVSVPTSERSKRFTAMRMLRFVSARAVERLRRSSDKQTSPG
jgi:hypothetical protein